MPLYLSRLLLCGFFLSSIFSATIPVPATAAGLVPCGRTIGTAAEQAPCTICHIVVGGKGIIDYGLQIMTFVALAIIVAMAVLYIVSTGDEGLMQTAKSGIKASLIGFAVMLGAWLIVSTTMRIFSASVPGLVVTTGGFSFSCDTTSLTRTGAGTGIGTPGGTGGGVCAGVNLTAEQQRMQTGGTVCNNSGVCPSCNTAAFDSYIVQYGTQYNVPVRLIQGLIARESSCDTNSVRTESDGTQSCGLMQVNTGSSSFSCVQLLNPITGIQEGVRILAAALNTAQTLKSQYGNTVTVNELAAAIHNAGPGQSSASVDCSPNTYWPTMPKWGCPINPGTAQFNACAIKNYACNVGAC